VRANRIRAHSSGGNEGLGVVDDVGLKLAGGAFDDGLFTLHEIENI